jgi:tagatose-1,6-bisphosphate aldolase
MTKEFRIVLSDTISDNQIFTSKVKVYIDDQQVGLIHELNVKCNAEKILPEIEIVFPDFSDTTEWAYSQDLAKKVNENIEKLKEFPQINVVCKKL